MRYLKPISLSTSSNRHNFAVLAIFRNEAHILKEWLEHYLRFGGSHFYLIDNNSDDDYMTVLNPFIESGLVDLFSCSEDGSQIGAYSDLLPLLTKQTEWIGVFDLDEFIYPTQVENISTVIDQFSGYESILIPWLSFGSSGHVRQPESVVEGFVRRGPANTSRAQLKAISRSKCIERISQHNPKTRCSDKVLSSGRNFGDELFIYLNESELTEFQLLNNHYRLQSRDYFERVKTRRPEVNEEVKDLTKSISFFDQYDQSWNEVVDTKLKDLTALIKCRKVSSCVLPVSIPSYGSNK